VKIRVPLEWGEVPVCPLCGVQAEPIPEVGWICLERHPFDAPATPPPGLVGRVVVDVYQDRVHADGGGVPINLVIDGLQRALLTARQAWQAMVAPPSGPLH